MDILAYMHNRRIVIVFNFCTFGISELIQKWHSLTHLFVNILGLSGFYHIHGNSDLFTNRLSWSIPYDSLSLDALFAISGRVYFLPPPPPLRAAGMAF